MNPLLLLFAFFLGPARASEAPGAVSVSVDYMGTTQILDADRKVLTPGQFAAMSGDWATHERYKKSYRLHRTASIMMWAYGGVGVVGGFYLTYFSAVGAAATGSAELLAFTATGLLFMGSGVVSLPLGFVWFFNGKKTLNDPLSWWRITELEGAAETYNAGLRPTGRRIEVRPIVTPQSLALAVRF